VQADVIFEDGKEMPDQNELLKKAQGTAISHYAVKHLTVICALLRKIFGTKREKLAAGCVKLHNGILDNLYSSPNSVSPSGWSNQCRRHGLGMWHLWERREGHIKVWSENMKERHRLRWEDDNRMDLKFVGWGDVDWIYLAEDRYR
jgi:hypothetical protein